LCRNEFLRFSLDPDLLSPIIHRFIPERLMENSGRAIRERGKNMVHRGPKVHGSASISASTTISLISPELNDKNELVRRL
jgi:hypothetical protein